MQPRVETNLRSLKASLGSGLAVFLILITTMVPTEFITASEDQGLEEQLGSLIDAEAYERALPIVRQLVEVDQKKWRGVEARLLGELGHRGEAIDVLHEMVEGDPGNAEAWGNMGWVLILDGQFVQGEEASQQAFDLDPNSMAWNVNLGHVYLLQGEDESAYSWYKRALPLIQNDEMLDSGPLADFDIFLNNGWRPEAIRAAKAWFEQRGPDAIAVNVQVAKDHAIADQAFADGQAFDEQGAYSEAARAFEESLAVERASGRPRSYDIGVLLSWLGNAQRKAGQYPDAEVTLREAIVLCRSMLPAGHPDVATSLNNLAFLLRTTGRYGEAEPLYREALSMRRTALPAGHPDIANSLSNLAELLWITGRYGEAESLFQEALATRRAALPVGHPDIATSLNNLALLLRTISRYDEAELLQREALAIERKALPAGHPNTATSLNNLALILADTGRYGEAEPLYREALAIERKALPAGHPNTATSLNNLAALLETTGRYGEAEPLYREALSMRRAALPAGHPDIATSLNNLAGSLETTGRYGEAESLFEEALSIRRAALPEGHPDIALSLHNLADLLDTTGRYGESEPLYLEALLMRRAALPAGHPDIANSLNNLAGSLETTGRYGEAEPLYREALSIYLAALPAGHPTIATSLNNLAGSLETTGRYGEAEPLYREALSIYLAALPADHPTVAMSLNNLAGSLRTNGRYGEAEPLYREALAIYRAALPEGHPDIALSLNNLAVLFNTTGRNGEAEPLYQEALAIAQAGGEPEVLWSVQGNLTDYYAAQPSLAILFGKQAVNTIQSVRQNLASAEQATQQAFLTAKEPYYRDLADQLIAAGRLPEANQVLSMLKEQEYFDFIRRDSTSNPKQTRADYNEFEQEQITAYEAAAQAVARAAAEYRELAELDPFELTPEQEARRVVLKAELDAASQAFQATLATIKTAFTGLSEARRQELLARQQLSQGKDDRGLVRDLSRLADANVALLHTIVLEDKVHLLLTLPETLLARQGAIGGAELNKAVQTLRSALTNPFLDPRPSARTLYDHLIGPIEADLAAAGIDTLMVGLDSTLRYLPLAALHDGEQYLIERYALTVFTDVARDNIKFAPRPTWEGIGLGVSLPHEAIGPTRSNFQALPAVPSELERIIRRPEADDDGVLPGRYFLDEAFTEDTLTRSLQFPVVHVASHFSLQPGNESMSFLLLGDGDTLSLDRLRTGNYDFGNVDLLTLSACDTAMSGQNANGVEVEGLGTLAQQLGAKSVVATLWPVADESTGEFMQHLYRLRQEDGLTKAEAIRQTQLAFLAGGQRRSGAVGTRKGFMIDAETSDDDDNYAYNPQAPYAHPYYWAPFILMGNWL